MLKPPPQYNSRDPAIYQIYSVFEQVVVHWPSLPNLALTLSRMNRGQGTLSDSEKFQAYMYTHIHTCLVMT